MSMFLNALIVLLQQCSCLIVYIIVFDGEQVYMQNARKPTVIAKLRK